MSLIFMISLLVALIGIDLITKTLAANKLVGESIVLIPNVFELTYVENRGAAWGIFEGRTNFLLLMTFIAMLVVVIFIFKIPKDKKYTWLRLSLVLIVAGGIGNFIDRIVLGYVRDMLHFTLIDFPVFNIADCCVVIGAGLLMFLILFIFRQHLMHKIVHFLNIISSRTFSKYFRFNI